MGTYQDLTDEVLGPIARLPVLEVPITDALGSALAAAVVCAGSVPSYSQAIWEGVAVKSDDVRTATPATPVILPIGMTIEAGKKPDALADAHCARVAANAALPSGTDAVVPSRRAVFEDDKVIIHASARPGEGVRAEGSAFVEGDEVVAAGEYLNHIQIAELALVGQPRVLVHPRPRVVIVTIGSELTRVSSQDAAFKIHDATGVLLTTAAASLGADAHRVGPVRDTPKLVLDIIEDQLVRADVVITAGGIDSEQDVLRQQLEDLGYARFDGAPIAPIGSYGIGRIGPEQTPIIALPGEPTLALLAFHALARPVITSMIGRTLQRTRTLPVVSPERLDAGSRVTPGRMAGDRFVPLTSKTPTLAELRGMGAIAIQHADESGAEVVEWPY